MATCSPFKFSAKVIFFDLIKKYIEIKLYFCRKFEGYIQVLQYNVV